MAKRKTYDVDTLRIDVNAMIADSAESAREGRIALAVMLENVLMKTGNYHGFRYADGDLGRRDDSRRVYF